MTELADWNRIPDNAFEANRNIWARMVRVVLDGSKLDTITGFTAVTKPNGKGRGVLTLDKVNSAVERSIWGESRRARHTLDVEMVDPGMPNAEVTRYEGVRIRSSGVHFSLSQTDMVTITVNFTFRSASLVEPVEEPVHSERVWETLNG